MRNTRTHYEPVFGGIVAILAAALLSSVVFIWKSYGTSYTATAFLLLVSGRGIFWGVGQIAGYRKAKRLLGSTIPSPLLGTALGCVFLGLTLALVTVLLYEFAREHPSYALLSGGVSAILLMVGAVVGIRQGVWRGDA